MIVKSQLTELESAALALINDSPLDAARILAALWEEAGYDKKEIEDEMGKTEPVFDLRDEQAVSICHFRERSSDEEKVCALQRQGIYRRIRLTAAGR